uniref:RING-type E3 ubiquitin transferase n=1 Tax=Kalanchoe fedtschenkoi TaxID=63787 RepID=A0A7N0UQ16_KALFE
MAEIIISVLFVVFSIGLLSLSIRCLLALSARSQTFGVIITDDPHGANAESGPRSLQRGMDSDTISAFPVVAYSDIKATEAGRGLVECVVCLSDFGDGDYVRLLPKCDHAFHPECIDKWLSKHVTCPICRTNLEPADEKPVETSEMMNSAGTFSVQNNHVRVNINEADHENRLLTTDGESMSICSSGHSNNNRV